MKQQQACQLPGAAVGWGDTCYFRRTRMILCQYWLKCFGYDMLVRQLHCESWLLGFASGLVHQTRCTNSIDVHQHAQQHRCPWHQLHVSCWTATDRPVNAYCMIRNCCRALPMLAESNAAPPKIPYGAHYKREAGAHRPTL